MKHSMTRGGLCGAFSPADLGAAGTTPPVALPRLQVSANRRFLKQEDGSPFFWLGDTGWYIWKLNPADVELYLSDRARQGFTVIQAHCGYDVTDFAGRRPFIDDNTYGHNEVCVFWRPGDPTEPPKASGQRAHWKQALQAPGAAQMRHLRALMESRSFFNRLPDPSLLVSPAGTGNDHVQATRASDGSYALIYLPAGGAVTVAMSKIAGDGVKASWFDPRTGSYTPIGAYPTGGARRFDAPGAAAPGNDWVLVLEAMAKT